MFMLAALIVVSVAAESADGAFGRREGTISNIRSVISELSLSLKEYDSMWFYHSRKCGGTTLRQWTETLAQSRSWKHAVQEGQTIKKDRRKRPSTLWITSLRNPIDRILSSYKFEGRWAQIERNRTTANALGLDEWINRTSAQAPQQFLWQCVSECFTKWFGGWSASETNLSVLYERAIRRLEEFEIIVIQEHLSDPLYQKTLGHVVHFDGAITHANKAGHGSWDEVVTSSQLQRLESLNHFDRMLYRRFAHMDPIRQHR